MNGRQIFSIHIVLKCKRSSEAQTFARLQHFCTFVIEIKDRMRYCMEESKRGCRARALGIGTRLLYALRAALRAARAGVINNCRENIMRKKLKCFFWTPITNRCNFQLSFGCTNLRVRWGHARRHGKRSLEMLTVERADYTQEMDCHYFNSWSVHRWMVCKSWLVLMGQLNIVVFGIFATFAVSFRLVLSVGHEPEIAGPTAPATASTRHWQPECFIFRE